MGDRSPAFGRDLTHTPASRVNTMLNTGDLVAKTLHACTSALASVEFDQVRRWLLMNGFDAKSSVAAVSQVTQVAATQGVILRLKEKIKRDLPSLGETSLERYLVLEAACYSLGLLEAEPLMTDVKRLICEEFTGYAVPGDGRTNEFTAGHNRFQTTCKIATLRRFPAGQFDWELSGIPRSWLLRLRGRNTVRLPAYLLTRVRGLQPLFFRHFGVRRPIVLMERAADSSYYRMAESMRLQPEVRGLAACGWFSSPDTHRVSPHLAWANRTICSNGGIAVPLGPADPSCGVLARSPERQRLYETGEFKPTLGLVVWDRKSMLQWADLRRAEMA